MPELDKLISLSEVFGVTLDELAKGDAVPRAHPESVQVNSGTTGTEGLPHKKFWGCFCLGPGFYAAMLALPLGEGFFLIGGYLLFCGAVCLCVKRNAGLVIGWATLIPILIFAPSLDGNPAVFRFESGFLCAGHLHQPNFNRGFLGFAAFLTVATVRRFRYKKKNRTESKTHK